MHTNPNKPISTVHYKHHLRVAHSSSSIPILPLPFLTVKLQKWKLNSHTETERSHSTKSLPAKVVENFSLSHRPTLWSYRYIYTTLSYRFLAKKHSHLFRFHPFALLNKWWQRFHTSHCFSCSHSSPPLFTSQVRYLQNSLSFRYCFFLSSLDFENIFEFQWSEIY